MIFLTLQLKQLGHSVDKVEFIVMGGTFMALPEDYRDYFIRNLHDALSGHTSNNVAEAVRWGLLKFLFCENIKNYISFWRECLSKFIFGHGLFIALQSSRQTPGKAAKKKKKQLLPHFFFFGIPASLVTPHHLDLELWRMPGPRDLFFIYSLQLGRGSCSCLGRQEWLSPEKRQRSQPLAAPNQLPLQH